MGLFEEFTYLSTKNKYRYNAIMELFLFESERINMEITEDYIYQKIKEEGLLYEEDYSRAQLSHDLQFLLENNNISIHEENLQNIHTLEEYKNRKKYYSITKRGAFVARYIRQFLLVSNKTVLCDEHFERLMKDIRICKHSNSLSAWTMLYDDSRNVFQIYQDFLAEFNGNKFDQLSGTNEFMAYKQDFLEQIHLLIDKLSKYAAIIGRELEDLHQEDKRLLAIKRWFLYIDEEEPTYIHILHYCSMLIEKITRKAKLLLTAGEESADYKKLLYEFLACNTLSDCENLSLDLLGFQQMPHMNYHGPYAVKQTELTERYEHEEEAFDEKQKLLDEKKALEYLDKEMAREQKILSMEKNHIIRFEEMKEMDTEETLTVLSWLGRAMEDKNTRSETASGRRFSLKTGNQEERITLQTKYGSLEMPDFHFVFEGKKDE